jgi:hypothetical protein
VKIEESTPQMKIKERYVLKTLEEKQESQDIKEEKPRQMNV